jgi:hypothetical protein
VEEEEKYIILEERRNEWRYQKIKMMDEMNIEKKEVKLATEPLPVQAKLHRSLFCT